MDAFTHRVLPLHVRRLPSLPPVSSSLISRFSSKHISSTVSSKCLMSEDDTPIDGLPGEYHDDICKYFLRLERQALQSEKTKELHRRPEEEEEEGEGEVQESCQIGMRLKGYPEEDVRKARRLVSSFIGSGEEVEEKIEGAAKRGELTELVLMVIWNWLDLARHDDEKDAVRSLDLLYRRIEARLAKISTHVLPKSSYKYDVFLSFRGPNTRRTFVDYLYECLVNAGISVFRDNEELHVGRNIGLEIKRAIDDSRIHMPIFSEGYASSPWCLEELARMVKRQRESAGQEIVPVFYGVSPSDVRLKTGTYGEALLKHEGHYGEETVQEWKEALMEVADLRGWDARNARLGKLIKDLVRDFSIKLKQRQKVFPYHLVGIDDQVKDMVQWLDCGSLDVRVLVVHGMGGIGKTTLAKAVYNEIAHQFDGCSSFLADIRECSRIGGIVSLQSQLLSSILKRSTDVHDVNHGVKKIQERFRNKRVLLVLDDIDKREQLMELTGNGDWLGPGSRIIITTRNVGLLATEEMGQQDNFPILPKEHYAYEMKEMNPWHALQLFSQHAFGETLPPDDRETLSSEMVATIGGIPLALEVLGCFLRGKSLEMWEETLERLRKVPDRRVQKTLRMSYEALSFEEKQIYLDIACFYNGMESTSAAYVWKDCGYFPESGLATLIDLSLLKMDDHNILRMHDLIRDFGKEIVRQENHLDGGSQSRLWESEELQLDGCHELKLIPGLPASLINLNVECHSFETVLNLSNLTNLVDLIESDSCEESLSNPWDANSVQTPNQAWVGRLSRLEKLKLVHESIISLPTELASLSGLKRLVLSCFPTHLLYSTLSMVKLVNLNPLAKLSHLSYLKNLSSLELCRSWLIGNPLCWFGQLENLRELTVSNCVFVVRLSSLSGLKKLRVLCLLNCLKLGGIQGPDRPE